MATEKTKRLYPAVVHGVTYGIPFLFLKPSIVAFAAIVVTHIVIDRWRLAKYLIWLKNFAGKPWSDCKTTGFPSELPIWLSTWLMFIIDNLCHILINGAALMWLG